MTQYHKFLKSWTTDRGITSFLGSDKPEFQQDWKEEKKPTVRFGETIIAKPKMEIVTEPMEIAEPTVSEKKTGLKIDLAMLKYKLASQASKKKLAEKLATQKKISAKLSPENVADFVKKLPREIEREIASYVIEKDPLMEFNSTAGLITFFYVLNLIKSPVVVGKIIYGLELTKSQKTNERMDSWNEGKTFKLNPEYIISNMPAVQSALISLMAKSKDFAVEAYYAGGMSQKKSIRAKIIWTGKKGQRNQDSLWEDYWTQHILPLIKNVTRWDKAYIRVNERRIEINTSNDISKEKETERRKLVGNELLPESFDISIKDIMKIISKLYAKHKFQTSGYTKWKDKNSVGYIVEMMKGIFNKQNEPDKLAVWNEFKKEIGI
jgi:hypothetical protein